MTLIEYVTAGIGALGIAASLVAARVQMLALSAKQRDFAAN
jgi:hypothetical protein